MRRGLVTSLHACCYMYVYSSVFKLVDPVMSQKQRATLLENMLYVELWIFFRVTALQVNVVQRTRLLAWKLLGYVLILLSFVVMVGGGDGKPYCFIHPGLEYWISESPSSESVEYWIFCSDVPYVSEKRGVSAAPRKQITRFASTVGKDFFYVNTNIYTLHNKHLKRL